MNRSTFAKSTLAAAFAALMAQSSLSLAAHPAMESKDYFDAKAYAERNKPAHSISEYRYQLSLNSLSQGLGGMKLPLLGVEQGPGRKAVMGELLERLGSLPEAFGRVNTGAETRVDQNKKRMVSSGDGWKLKVHGDGTRVQFRNYGYLDPKEDAMGRLERIEPQRLVEMGRGFISYALSDHVKLGPDEELVPFGVQYQVNTEQSPEFRSKPKHTTVAATVIFNRKVGGVDMVGRGSKVAVMYANDGMMIGFDYDWPTFYDVKEMQKIAPLSEIQQRALEVARLEKSVDIAQLERFECGYYDPGQSRRSDVPLQPACYHFYSGQSRAEAEDGQSGMLSMAFSDPVPAGTEIIPDEQWDTALELLYGPWAVPERAQPGEQPERSTTEYVPGIARAE